MGMTEAVRESTTLKLIIPLWGALLFKFVCGGLDFGYGEFPIIEAGEFGLASAGILAIWLGREWKETHYAKQD